MVRLRKIIAGFLAVLVAANIFIASAPQAEAIFGLGDIVHDPINYIVNALHTAVMGVGNMALGLPGTGAGVKGAMTAAKTPCQIAQKASEIADAATVFQGPEALVGNTGQLAALQAKITALTVVKNCYQAVLTGGAVGGSLAAASGIQALIAIQGDQTQLQLAINDINQRLDAYKKLRSDTVADIWKAVAVRILYTVQQKITTDTVNKLVAKYQISNYLGYADALATQVYNIDYIDKYVPAKQDQAIMRSISQNELVKGQVLPLIQIKAQEALGFDPRSIDNNASDFYAKMARVGAADTQGWLQQQIAQGQADIMKATSLDLARQEMSNGNGFMPVRNCSDVTTQQKSFDQQRVQLSSAVKTYYQIYSKLNNQKTLNPSSVSDQDLTRAYQDFTAKQQALSSVPDTSTAFVKTCNAIQNPGAAVSNEITGFLNSQLNSASKPDNQNLPFFANFVEGIASNFLTNIIEKGVNSLISPSGGGSLNVVSGKINPVAVIGSNPQTSQFKQAESTDAQQSATFTADPTSVAGQYTVSWDAGAFTNAASIAITGGSSTYTSSSTAGTTLLKVTIPASAQTATLTLNVYDANNQLLTTANASVSATINTTVNVTDTNTIDNSVSQINSQQTALEDKGVVQPDTLNQSTAPSLSANKISDNPTTYTISWSNVGAAYSNASYVKVSGPSISNQVQLNLTDSLDVTLTQDGESYVVGVYSASGSLLSSQTITLYYDNSRTAVSLGNGSNVGRVAGAFVSKIPLNIRGTSKVVHPRGE